MSMETTDGNEMHCPHICILL